MTLRDILNTGVAARFVRLEDEQLWYSITFSDERGVTYWAWEFPVPIEDTMGGAFLAEEKPVSLLRWIRQHLEQETTSPQNE